MTRDELLALPAVVPLWPTAGRAWGLGKSTTYELAQRGEFPCAVQRLGTSYRVVTEHLLESLGIRRTPDMSEAGPATGPAAAITTADQDSGGPGHDQRPTALPRSA